MCKCTPTFSKRDLPDFIPVSPEPGVQCNGEVAQLLERNATSYLSFWSPQFFLRNQVKLNLDFAACLV